VAANAAHSLGLAAGSQVYPLAQLEASCSADGTRLQQLESACWNQEYRPAPNLVVLAVTFQFNGDCDGCIGGCPDERRSDYVRSLAAYVVSEQLLEYRVDARVKAAVLECKVRGRGEHFRLWYHVIA
jgi:hypothetical protein